MNARLSPVVEQLKLNAWLFERALAGLTDEEAARRHLERGNTIQWIAGHLTVSRYSIASLAGLPDEPPFGGAFARGAPLGEPASYPPLSAILEQWRTVGNRVAERLPALTDADLDALAPVRLPIGDRTILGGFAFLALHETYHVGQLGYLRRLLGKGAVVE